MRYSSFYLILYFICYRHPFISILTCQPNLIPLIPDVDTFSPKLDTTLLEMARPVDSAIHPDIRILPTTVIQANWQSDRSPVIHSTLSQKKLEQKVFLQDIPQLLQALPSTVATSDAGNGIGYTGIRIRGLDPTQINVLINGIPLNDAESQAVFWVDLPDMIASASEIQVQRGIGFSGSGQVAFGSSILINTNQYITKPTLQAELGMASYGTYKSGIQGGFRFWKNRAQLKGRLSHIRSEGYVDRAFSRLYSGNLSFSYVARGRSLQFHLFDGYERTYQAWYGLPIQYVNTAQRRFNTAGTEKKDSPYENQIDRYRQTHFQLLHSEIFSDFLTLTNTVHYTPGGGYYEEYKADQSPIEYGLPEGAVQDLVRRRYLQNDFFGSIHTLKFLTIDQEAQLGLAWNRYTGRHYGQAIYLGGRDISHPPFYYDQNATKSTGMLFGKWGLKKNKWEGIVDFQVRGLEYRYIKENDPGEEEQRIHLLFFNPKIGFTYSWDHRFQLTAFSGIASREPNRNDYVSADANLPKPEKMINHELAIRYRNINWKIEQNFYFMDYTNQLVPTGRLNDVGAYVRSNVPISYRLGAESSLEWSLQEKWWIHTNATFSKNRARRFIEYIDQWHTGLQEAIQHQNKPIAFSPSFIFNVALRRNLFSSNHHSYSHQFYFDGHWQYIGSQYLDGTGSQYSKLPAYDLCQLGISYTFTKSQEKRWDLKLQCNNLFNRQYLANGWIYRFYSPDFNPVPSDPYSQSEGNSYYSQKGVYPQAGRNLAVMARIYF
jgi:iron complex outermembrane recepter protein